MAKTRGLLTEAVRKSACLATKQQWQCEADGGGSTTTPSCSSATKLPSSLVLPTAAQVPASAACGSSSSMSCSSPPSQSSLCPSPKHSSPCCSLPCPQTPPVPACRPPFLLPVLFSSLVLLLHPSLPYPIFLLSSFRFFFPILLPSSSLVSLLNLLSFGLLFWLDLFRLVLILNSPLQSNLHLAFITSMTMFPS